MPENSIEASGAAEEYYVIPEDALHLLPEEWQKEIQAVAEDGRTVLKSVDDELSQISRLSNSFLTLVLLKHIRTRLAEYRFAADVDAILDLDMLKDWLEVEVGGRHQRITGLEDAVDDIIGPLVNREVKVTFLRRGKRMRYLDIEEVD